MIYPITFRLYIKIYFVLYLVLIYLFVKIHVFKSYLILIYTLILKMLASKKLPFGLKTESAENTLS